MRTSTQSGSTVRIAGPFWSPIYTSKDSSLLVSDGVFPDDLPSVSDDGVSSGVLPLVSGGGEDLNLFLHHALRRLPVDGGE